MVFTWPYRQTENILNTAFPSTDRNVLGSSAEQEQRGGGVTQQGVVRSQPLLMTGIHLHAVLLLARHHKATTENKRTLLFGRVELMTLIYPTGQASQHSNAAMARRVQKATNVQKMDKKLQKMRP